MGKKVLGIDIGGTGIKGAIVDTKTGEMITDKIKYKTPKPSTPDAVMGVVKQLIQDLGAEDLAMGIGFPAIIKKGVSHSAANIDSSWKGFNIKKFFKSQFDVKVKVVNDADAAGIAEVRHGAAKGVDGAIILLTLGTGIGSAYLLNQVLVPNTEFGHLKWKDSITEDYASNRAKKTKDLDWPAFGQELSEVLNHLDLIFSPDLFILGGGISKHFQTYAEYLTIKPKIIPASLQNNAGLIGAAINVTL